jgi:hypothetical protein
VSQKTPIIEIPERIETQFDRLYFSYFSEEVEAMLSEAERRHRDRVDDAWHHMVGRKSPLSAAEWLQTKHTVSRSTAFRIVRDALQLFGDVIKTSRDAKRRLLWEYSLRGLDKCLEIEDMRAYAAILKNMTTFEGLNLEDKTFEGGELKPHTYEILLQVHGKRELRFNADAIEEMPADQYAEALEAVEDMTTSVEEMDGWLDQAEKKGKKKK